MFQIVFLIISVSFEFISSVMVLPYSRGRHGKLTLAVTGLTVPILTRVTSDCQGGITCTSSLRVTNQQQAM